MSFNPRLLTPPREEEEIYPYRRVWRSLVIEGAILAIATAGLFVVANFIGLRLPAALVPVVNILLALSPAVLWLIFSRLPENAAVEPRRYMNITFIIGILVASAIAMPLIHEFLQPERWLSLKPAVNRIIGYTVTVGIVQEALKYLVLRLIVPAEAYRVRVDGIAYSATVAIAFATVTMLHYVGSNLNALPDVVMLRVLTVTALNLAASSIVSYGIVETRLGSASVFLMPFTLVVAAFLNGLAIPLRSGLVNAQLTLDGGATRPYFALAFAVVLLVVPLFVMSFLYRAADRREEDVVRGQES
jgi:RsiW-degrading membrane proteinase PrsW (M82 family)